MRRKGKGSISAASPSTSSSRVAITACDGSSTPLARTVAASAERGGEANTVLGKRAAGRRLRAEEAVKGGGGGGGGGEGRAALTAAEAAPAAARGARPLLPRPRSFAEAAAAEEDE